MNKYKKSELLTNFWRDLSVLSQRNINLLAENIITFKQFEILKKHLDDATELIRKQNKKLIEELILHNSKKEFQQTKGSITTSIT